MSQLAACPDTLPMTEVIWGIRLPLPLFGGRRASPDACYKRQDGFAGYRSDRYERVVKVVKEHLTVIVVVDILVFGKIDDVLRQFL